MIFTSSGASNLPSASARDFCGGSILFVPLFLPGTLSVAVIAGLPNAVIATEQVPLLRGSENFVAIFAASCGWNRAKPAFALVPCVLNATTGTETLPRRRAFNRSITLFAADLPPLFGAFFTQPREVVLPAVAGAIFGRSMAHFADRRSVVFGSKVSGHTLLLKHARIQARDGAAEDHCVTCLHLYAQQVGQRPFVQTAVQVGRVHSVKRFPQPLHTRSSRQPGQEMPCG